MARRSLSEQTFLVLTALSAEPLHGYGIVRAASELSGGEVTLRVGTLYGALDRLCADGLVEPDREEIHQGRARRYYRITDTGMAELVRDAGRRAHMADVALERGRASRRVPGLPTGEASA
ncbi:PadR family transcriptional regulator [Actinomycetospora succinea]|uniref:PadR family transcriptional regulator n=1 Tax=Actinomycetospora succinea TaxID=663603 RepID=A0A4R6UZX4_9PSEU|nr:PadR family transcriptional regulator [Actinomycetospora succinea]TDQ51876.1 PadR family transcriptional regulator [Actinomycetospora succinea]